MPSTQDQLDTLQHDPRAWLEANVARIAQVVACAARRRRLSDQDREELLSILWTHMARDDYRVLRSFRGSSGITTYLTVVTERLVLDLRTAAWGKWRPSARARRHGGQAMLFERLVHRDGLSVEDAHKAVRRATGGSVDRDVEIDLLRRVPYRRRQFVQLEQASHCPSPADPWLMLLDRQHARRGSEIGRRLELALRGLPTRDQVLLRMRHEQGLKVSEIATMLDLDAKKLYRRLAMIHAHMRARLVGMGVSPHEASDVVGDHVSHVPPVFERLARAS